LNYSGDTLILSIQAAVRRVRAEAGQSEIISNIGAEFFCQRLKKGNLEWARI
jgi:hypothetical protein